MQQGGGAAQLLAFPLTRHPVGVDDDVVHGESRSVLGQHVQMTLDGEPGGLPGSATRLSTRARRADVARSAAASSGTNTCGITLVNHEPGPSTTRSAAMMASTACRVAGVVRQQPHPAHLARGGRDRHLAADHPEHPRVAFQAGHVGLDLQGDPGTSAAPCP